VLTDIREGDVGAILGWGFAPWSGGPFSWLDMLGAAYAAERCDALEAAHGDRFACPALLRDLLRPLRHGKKARPRRQTGAFQKRPVLRNAASAVSSATLFASGNRTSGRSPGYRRHLPIHLGRLLGHVIVLDAHDGLGGITVGQKRCDIVEPKEIAIDEERPSAEFGEPWREKTRIGEFRRRERIDIAGIDALVDEVLQLDRHHVHVYGGMPEKRASGDVIRLRFA
jgi:hypothetical protein